MLDDLAGKSIVITAGGTGIGAALAEMLGEAGSHVTIACRNDEHGAQSVERVERAGGRAHFVRTDVTSEQSVKNMIDAAVSHFGRLDGAANSAGVPQTGKALADISASEWDHVHSVNLRGMFLCVKYEILAMLSTGGGSIVNVSSSGALVGFHQAADYSASKAGILGLTRGAAVDYATQGIRVNALLPGGTLTTMLAAAMEADPLLEAGIASTHPIGRFAQPREIAAAARWLLSDEASFTTGASISVDGGHTAF